MLYIISIVFFFTVIVPNNPVLLEVLPVWPSSWFIYCTFKFLHRDSFAKSYVGIFHFKRHELEAARLPGIFILKSSNKLEVNFSKDNIILRSRFPIERDREYHLFTEKVFDPLTSTYHFKLYLDDTIKTNYHVNSLEWNDVERWLGSPWEPPEDGEIEISNFVYGFIENP